MKVATKSAMSTNEPVNRKLSRELYHRAALQRATPTTSSYGALKLVELNLASELERYSSTAAVAPLLGLKNAEMHFV